MKFSHAAALALVGWYLMYAPQRGSYGFNYDAPLWQWSQLADFDTAAQCEAARSKKWAFPMGKNSFDAQALWFGKCISTDDRRLVNAPCKSN